MTEERRARRRDQEREALMGLECALPSRELRLASPTPARRSIWRRALAWLRGAGERQISV